MVTLSLNENNSKLKKLKTKQHYFTFSTFWFISYLMADILVSGIITKEATGVFLNSTGESNHIHSNAKKRRQKMNFHAINWQLQ